IEVVGAAAGAMGREVWHDPHFTAWCFPSSAYAAWRCSAAVYVAGVNPSSRWQAAQSTALPPNVASPRCESSWHDAQAAKGGFFRAMSLPWQPAQETLA